MQEGKDVRNKVKKYSIKQRKENILKILESKEVKYDKKTNQIKLEKEKNRNKFIAILRKSTKGFL